MDDDLMFCLVGDQARTPLNVLSPDAAVKIAAARTRSPTLMWRANLLA
jgi:hypothetical protein